MAKPFAKHVLMAKHTLERRNGFEVDQGLIDIDFDELGEDPPRGDRAEPAGPFERPGRQAAVAFARALIEARGKASDAQFAAVKDAGWTDANIVEMIALTAQFLLTNFMNNAVQMPIDFPAVSPAESA
jgi:alkylhydroperoxidase family enzyme